MISGQPKRKRGVVLTPSGRQKLQEAIRAWEERENFGEKLTIEELSDRTKLDAGTVAKVLDCEEGVDRRTLERFFRAFNLELFESEYRRTLPRQQEGNQAQTTSMREETVDVSILASTEEVSTLEGMHELGDISGQEPSREACQKLWNIQQRRNDFFTGREEVLKELRNTLTQNNKAVLVQVQAISGLGGIGKTQTAIEYAYRYIDLYQAVFWIKADDPLSMTTDFIEIAKLLDLPQKDAQDPETIIRAVKSWLEAVSGWLLILDSADEPAWIKAYLPRQIQGHILLTSRAQDFQMLGVSQPIEIQELSLDEAVLFLFKRTGCRRNDPLEMQASTELAQELGCLPLALEQAGAYIRAKKARIQDYLVSYRKRYLELLEQAKPVVGDYPKSVVSTWALNFYEVEKISPASADLMRFSAFLYADSIPYELITQAMGELGSALSTALVNVNDDPLVLNETLEPLTRFSLIRIDRDAQSYSTHRLVQAVLKSRLEPHEQQLWAERTVHAVSLIFPAVSYDNWILCERLLTHGKTAAKLVEEFQFSSEAAANLLSRVGCYLFQRAQYAESQPLMEKVLQLRKRFYGEKHTAVATSIHDLALLYYSQARYTQAEPLFVKALELRKYLLGENHTDIAASLHDLAVLYFYEGRYQEAEPLFLKSLTLRKQLLGEDHQEVATSLHNLGNLYKFQGRYKEAETLYLQAREIRRNLLGEEHPDFADSLNNLALLYYYQGQYSQAEPLYLKVIAFDRKFFGEEHPSFATSLNNLALLYHKQGQYEEAETFFLQSLSIRESVLGQEHPLTSQSLNNLAGLYESQKRYSEAEPMYERALELDRRLLGNKHPDLADSLNDLANLYKIQGRYSEAETLYNQALALAQDVLRCDHPLSARSLYGLGSLKKLQGQYREAEPLLIQALEISEGTSGIDHPNTILYRACLEEIRSFLEHPNS